MKTRPTTAPAAHGATSFLQILGGLAALCAATAGAQDNQLLNLSGVPREERTILPVAKTWPAAPGEAALCLWADDKTAAITYGIDDNCAMNIDWWLGECDARGVRMTWFLVASGISKSNPAMNGKWEDWRKVAAAGHGLESHTMTHLGGSRDAETWKGIEWEYAESLKTISESIGGGWRATCIAYPGGSYPGTNDPSVAARHAIAGRGTRGTLNGPQGSNYLDVHAMSKHNINDNPAAAFSNVQNLLDPSSKNGYRGWAVLFWHYIREGDSDQTATARKSLDFYVRNKDELWQGRFGDVARYAQERESATLSVTDQTASRIVVRLTDRMRDDIFDHPLTVKLRLPDTWAGATASQGGKALPVRLVRHDGGTFALVGIVPDRGDAIVTQDDA